MFYLLLKTAGQKNDVSKCQPIILKGKWYTALSLDNIKSGQKNDGEQKPDLLRSFFSVCDKVALDLKNIIPSLKANDKLKFHQDMELNHIIDNGKL